MKLIIVALAVLVAAAAAAPQELQVFKILRSEYDQQPEGSYKFGFDTENGISRNEEGERKQVLDEENKPHDVIVMRGSFTYLDEQGNTKVISYYADETGFHAEGEAIPKGPARR